MQKLNPWQGVIVATPLPFKDDLSVDYDAFAEHVQWLAENGADGVAPNGSLGEYQTLSDEERRTVIDVAVDAAPEGFSIMPGVGAYGYEGSVKYAKQALEAGAHALMALPPNIYPANKQEVIRHYEELAKVGLPVAAYNNPADTKIDMDADFLVELYDRQLIVGVKEFSQDPRRVYQILEKAPNLDVSAGGDDLMLEQMLAGATGWVAGFTSVFPKTTIEIYNAAKSRDVKQVMSTYSNIHSLLRWDSRVELVQSIKFAMDLVGLKGGPCRSPRLPLSQEQKDSIKKLVRDAQAMGYA